MDTPNKNMIHYNKMEELQEKLKKSEEERMLLQRQFDLLLQATQDKERARVSTIEARYRKILDEDKRRRDRNSSLLQAMDRIDNHTASLAAKTERMRMLRRQYEAFIAHAYPSWHLQMERSYCPMAPLPSTSRLLGSDFSGYVSDYLRPQDHSDFSETHYLDLPIQRRYPVTPPRSRSELSIASRDECPVIGRPSYRNGSSIRSKSLSPTRVGASSSGYNADQIISRSFPSYSLSQVYDTSLSPRVRSEALMSKALESNQFQVSPRLQPDFLSNQTPDRYLYSQKTSLNGYHSQDYDRGNSDVEADQNTSGDLLNFSNLSVSDDGVLDADISDSPLSDMTRKSFSSPRLSTEVRRGKYNSSPSTQLSPRSNFSPRESFISRASERHSPISPLDYTEKPVSSPRIRTTSIPTSMAISDNVHRILLSPQDVATRRSDISLSPRKYKPSWQMHRSNYPQPSHSAVRRTVTFTTPEYGVNEASKYHWQDDDPDLFLGSLSRFRRYSPSIVPSDWEPSDHERFLREKQGREKGAFQEKIQRLKDLIQENKEQETGMNGTVKKSEKTYSRKLTDKEDQRAKLKDEEDIKDSFIPRNLSDNYQERSTKSRRSSLEKDSSMPYSSHILSYLHSNGETENGEDQLNSDNIKNENISEKEQSSGQFTEKDDVDQKEHHFNFNSIEKYGKEEPTFDKKEEEFNDDFKSGNTETNRAFSFEKQSDPIHGEYDLSLDSSHNAKKTVPLAVNMDMNSTEKAEKPDFSHPENQTVKDDVRGYSHQQNTHPTPSHEDESDYRFKSDKQHLVEQQVGNRFQLEQEHLEEQKNHSFDQDQQPGQEHRANYNLQQDQEQTPAYNYKQDQQPHQNDGMDYSYSQDQPTPEVQGTDLNYQQRADSLTQDSNYNYSEGSQPTQNDGFRFNQDPSQQWNNNQMEEQISQQQNAHHGPEEISMEYSHPNSGDYSSQGHSEKPYKLMETLDYPNNSHPEQQSGSFETYQQPSTQKDLSDGVYEPYNEEGQNNSNSSEMYQGYTSNSDQYPQDFQNYSQDQYNQQQGQGYAQPAKENYQFEENRDNAQYQYGGQDYSYQENSNGFTYEQNQSYPVDQQYSDQMYKDQQYPPESQYQQDQKYVQETNYPQEQLYQQNSDYQNQEPRQNQNYPQDEQFEGNAYQTSQPYDNYNASQQGPEEFSESTSESYQHSYPEGGTFENQQMVDQYRSILGADPNSEPAYSEASEIENQMAAVVGQGEASTTKPQDPAQTSGSDSVPTVSPATPAPPFATTPAVTSSAPAAAPVPSSSTPTPTPAPPTSTPTTAPTSSTPTPSTPTPTPTSATRGKAAVKKKPQLTRKQSSLSSDSSDSKPQAPSLSRMSESASESTKASK